MFMCLENTGEPATEEDGAFVVTHRRKQITIKELIRVTDRPSPQVTNTF